MAAMKDRRHERVAELLSAMKTPEQASAEAGYDTKAKSFASNARKRACRPDIKARVAELQGQIAACMVIDAAWLRDKMAKIAGTEIADDDIRASDVIAAANLLAKMIPGALAPTKVMPSDADGNQLLHVFKLEYPQPKP